MTMMIERHETKASRPMSERIAALERMTASQLRREYAEVFGEESRSGNRQWLFRRIAWRIQFDAGGTFAQRADEKARALAKVHAADADIRSGPPKAPPPLQPHAPAVTVHVAAPRDGRLPPPGSVIVRKFKGRDHHVKVLPVGFEHEGGHYKSLSAVAHAITGSHWNGMLFFGLAGRRKEGAST